MALLSVLTPVLAVVLCLVIGFMLVRSRETETTLTSSGKSEGVAKQDFRPWVDQDLQDDTEITKVDGKSWTETFFFTGKLYVGNNHHHTDLEQCKNPFCLEVLEIVTVSSLFPLKNNAIYERLLEMELNILKILVVVLYSFLPKSWHFSLLRYFFLPLNVLKNVHY